MTTVPCASDPELFASTERRHHEFAKVTCLGRRRPDGSQVTAPCFFLAQCKKDLDAAREEFGVPHGPEGTWAGLLVTAARGESTDATHDDEECKQARAMASRGDRSPWVVAGVRTYERRRRTAKRAAAKAAA
jgi:hypothetical protein